MTGLARHVLGRVALNSAVGVGSLLVVSVLGAPVLVQSPAPADDPASASPGAEDVRAQRHDERVAALLVEHHCWSGEAPADAPVPGHAVVTTPAGKVRLVPADVGFGIWLEGDEGVLHGFCP